MRMKIGDHLYRPKLRILGETGLIRGEQASYYSDRHTCNLDGFQGTRKQMVWHIKRYHKEYLEMVK